MYEYIFTKFVTQKLGLTNRLTQMTNNLQPKNCIPNFGARLRQRRKELKLSQEALGVSIGLDESCSRTRISRYEAGIHEPNLTTVGLLAKTLSIPVAYLYCERDSIANFVLAIYKLPDDEIELIVRNLFLYNKLNI